MAVTRLDLERALRLEGFDARAAQRRMEPVGRAPAPRGGPRGAPRPAAALAYLYEEAGRWRLPLTVRPAGVPEHGGQVALPGGRPAPGESSWETAVREAHEEVGLQVSGDVTRARLAPVYIPVTHTRLDVHVALGPAPGTLVGDPREVERIVVVPLDALLDPAAWRVRMLPIGGRDVLVPYFDVAGLFLWGATAIALAELVHRLRRARVSAP